MLLQFGGAAAVIDVAVGEQDLFQRGAAALDHLEQLLEVAAGIDQRGAAGGLAHDERTVLLERSDGNDADFHARNT